MRVGNDNALGESVPNRTQFEAVFAYLSVQSSVGSRAIATHECENSGHQPFRFCRLVVAKSVNQSIFSTEVMRLTTFKQDRGTSKVKAMSSTR